MRRKEKEDRPDNILLVLGSMLFYGKPIEGRTRLQKIVFLLKTKYGLPFDFDFKPYYYGPYSEELSDVISLLRALGFAEEKIDSLGLDKIRYDYFLTEKGKRYFEQFSRSREKNMEEVVEKLRRNISELSSCPTPKLILEAKSLMKVKSIGSA
jgi:uncharacterized protein YwgA